MNCLEFKYNPCGIDFVEEDLPQIDLIQAVTQIIRPYIGAMIQSLRQFLHLTALWKPVRA
jgi:hypothetical protein